MSRLTNKIKDNYYLHTTTTDETDFKLGKLEDIEEEIGCPLEVVFKALKNGIVYSESVCPCHLEQGITDDNYYFVIGYKYPSWYCLKDYKKTWWLKEDKSE